MLPRTILLEAAIPPQHLSVFSTLLKANEELGIHATLRVAGGWVRDTLLGVHSNDIDIAIETAPGSPLVSGEHFAREVARYQAGAMHAAERTVSVIRVNPALSKHIETATVCVNNIAVEFCALRTDDYTSESRIPTIRPATPCEDALRRDFTINALFYNLHSKCVEDFTSGLEDLDNRVIRCPIPPAETFNDDPLRLLRGVRFVGQLGDLGFELESSIPAAVDEHILQVLQLKVSRERVGKEFLKMMSSPQPAKCLQLLLSMNLLQKVLLVEVHLPPSKKKQAVSQHPLRTTNLIDTVATPEEVCKVWSAVIRSVVPLFKNQNTFRVPEESQVIPILFALVIVCYRGLSSQEVEDRLIALCMNGLKLSQIQFQGIRRMVEAYHKLLHSQLSPTELNDVGSDLQEDTKVKFFDTLSLLHDPSVVPDALKVVLCMYMLLEWHYDDFCEANTCGSPPEAAVRVSLTSIWEPLERLPSLLNAFSLTLPLKGNDIRNSLQIPPKEIGTALMDLRRQMALYPGTVDSAADALVWLRSRFPGSS